jgi:hypothetical protein
MSTKCCFIIIYPVTVKHVSVQVEWCLWSEGNCLQLDL